MALPVIIDCDPGHDDAIALVLALVSPELNVKAVTSSAGNQTPDKTLRNVLRMLTLLKRPARQRRAGHHRRNRPANQRRPAAQQPP